MKKISIIFLSFLLFSCADLLVEEPKSIAVEVFYQTKDDLEAALAAINQPIRASDAMGGRFPGIHNSMVDYAQGRAGHAPLSEFKELDATNENRVYNMWSLFYKGISNANFLIKNAPNAEQVSQQEILKYIGEAKFMRGLIYFIIVRNWGGVPLRTEENMEEMDVPRSSIEDVYSLIVKDLLYAEENLPENPPVIGRASKWTAKTVLADVYFYMEKYTDARDKALEVINSNKFALVEVSEPDDFLNLFGPEYIVTSSVEEIFYIKYTTTSLQGYTFPRFIAHPNSGYHGGGGNYIIYSDYVNNPVIRDWDKENDLRYAYGWHEWDIGFGPTTILSKKFQDPEAPGGYNGGSNDYPWYRYADLLLLYSEADCHAAEKPTIDAMEKLNMVRRRAYGKNSLRPSEIDFKIDDYDKDSFIDLVLKERGYETQMESKRWMDLKRSGKVKEIIKEATGKDVSDVCLLWPIPPNEMGNNKAISPEDQNPGY